MKQIFNHPNKKEDPLEPARSGSGGFPLKKRGKLRLVISSTTSPLTKGRYRGVV